MCGAESDSTFIGGYPVNRNIYPNKRVTAQEGDHADVPPEEGTRRGDHHADSL